MYTKDALSPLLQEEGWGRTLFRNNSTETLRCDAETLVLERALWLAIDKAAGYLSQHQDTVKVHRMTNGTRIVVMHDGTQIAMKQDGKIAMNADSLFAFVLPQMLSNTAAVTELNSTSNMISKSTLQSPAVFGLLKAVMDQKSVFANVIIAEGEDFLMAANQTKIKDLNMSSLIEDWTDEQKKYRQKNDEDTKDILVTDLMMRLAENYASGKVITVMMDGVSAGGKTTTCKKVCSMLGLPYYSTNYSVGASEETILGRFVPDGKGGAVFALGQFSRAFIFGGMYVAEEFNRARPDVAVILNRPLGEGVLELPTGEVYYQHPAFRFAMAINPGYAGTKPLDMSFVRRMDRAHALPSMSADQMFKIARKRVPDIDDATLQLMIKVAKEVEEKYTNEAIPNSVVAVNHVINWADEYLQVGDLLEAAIPTIINGTCTEDEVREEVRDNIVKKYAR